MTKSEKQMLINHLNTELKSYMVEMWNDKKQDYEAYVCWHTHDVENVIESLIESPEKASLNYEAEYNRLREELAKMQDEVCHWKQVSDVMEKRTHDLQMILNTLEFICGRKFEGI